MNTNILKKYNTLDGAPKVLFSPINTLSTDFCNVFAVNGFEVHSMNFAGDFKHEEYMKKHKTSIKFITQKLYLMVL